MATESRAETCGKNRAKSHLVGVVGHGEEKTYTGASVYPAIDSATNSSVYSGSQT
ncbi:hypothetical protein PHLCEN_2v12070 [Hermanssonia centrifuga]|uniref:Uncharacterized protein n=1 Tax=Hermanssonia centrifuga TaxID=98765 RepID=A0A2R6NI58_9APHY|nr:hypothetical protein PHLCEN_2v12070 [Hermanssonia centrifuga]